MRYSWLLLLVLLCMEARSQRACPNNSKLYQFDPNSQPRNFTEKLGNHPEFPFLQKENGVTSVDAFIKSINDADNQQKYAREFKAFDLLLHNSGFGNGYKDLSEKNVENIYVIPGTIGNLGFYDKQKDVINYIYVKLNPAGEELAGVAAWKLTNQKGCYLYILHTCGNAFYPNNKLTSGVCCKAVTADASVRPLQLKNDSFNRVVHVTINFYQARISAAKHRGSGSGYDTLVRFVRRLDTATLFKDGDFKTWTVYSKAVARKIVACKDTSLHLFPQLQVDSSTMAAPHDSIMFTVADTTYLRDSVYALRCYNRWEFTLEGGFSANSAPRLNTPLEHTQTTGRHPAFEFTISRIFKQWFQLGLSAAYINLSYESDFPFAGSVPGTYSQVYVGNPIFPIQLFGKANIGKQIGWQANVSLSAGYSIPTYSKVVNNGFTLAANPQTKPGPTAGFKMGLAYFFSCKFGLGINISHQYFSNQSTFMNYRFVALPITAGIHVRF